MSALDCLKSYSKNRHGSVGKEKVLIAYGFHNCPNVTRILNFANISYTFMMKRVVIVHCWGGKPDYCWYPWAKQQLEAAGFQVDVPALPNTDFPQLSQWLPALQKTIGEPSEGLYIVTHSLGTITAMHYLNGLGKDVKIGGLVIVAGNFTDRGYSEMTNFFETGVDFERIQKRLAKTAELIYSDDDPWVPPAEGQMYQKALGAEFTLLKGRGHFSGPVDQKESCTELPEVVAAIKKLG